MAGSSHRFGTATEAGPIDSLMRALLYVAQQVGRPLSEADVRRLAAVPAAGLDEQRLPDGRRPAWPRGRTPLDLTPDRLDDLPLPFALVARRPAGPCRGGRPGRPLGRARRRRGPRLAAVDRRGDGARHARPGDAREAARRAARGLVCAALDARAAGDPEARRGLVRDQRPGPRHAALHDAGAEQRGRPRSARPAAPRS